MGLAVLLGLFAAYAVIDGAEALWIGLDRRKGGKRWGLPVLEGAAGIAFGLLVVIWPQTTAVVLLLFIAAWAVVTGLFQMVDAYQHKTEIARPLLFGLGGLVSLVLGLLLVIWPLACLTALVWLVGIYALLFGVLYMTLAFGLRSTNSA